MSFIAVYLRFLQLYTHAAHNLTKGPTFLSYHDFFGELYPQYESDFDDVIERMIGLGEKVDIEQINLYAADLLKQNKIANKSAADMFKVVLGFEQVLCDAIKAAYPKATIGTQQLVGEICNKAEMRQYKLGQLLK